MLDSQRGAWVIQVGSQQIAVDAIPTYNSSITLNGKKTAKIHKVEYFNCLLVKAQPFITHCRAQMCPASWVLPRNSWGLRETTSNMSTLNLPSGVIKRACWKINYFYTGFPIAMFGCRRVFYFILGTNLNQIVKAHIKYDKQKTKRIRLKCFRWIPK